MSELTYEDFVRARDMLRAANGHGDTIPVDPNAPHDPTLARLMEEIGNEPFIKSEPPDPLIYDLERLRLQYEGALRDARDQGIWQTLDDADDDD